MAGVDLAEVDRRQHRRLQALALRRAEAPEPITARDLGFVLHDVLVDAFRRNREVGARHDAWWARIEPVVAQALTRSQVDQQLFLVGAYGTVVGVELAVAEPERALVLDHFRAAAKGVVRLRRRRPGRWHIDRAVGAYRAAKDPTASSYLHVASVFTDACAAASARPDLVEAASGALGAVALDAFYDAAAGTVHAVTSAAIVE